MITTPLFEPSFVVAAAGDAIFTSECDVAEFRELSPAGELRRIVRWTARGDRTVGPEDVEAVRQAALAEDETEEDRRRTAEYMDARPVNDAVPTCSGIEAGPDGAVWVLSFIASFAEPQEWRVFDDGLLTGTIRLPPRSRLLDIGPDRFATLQLDELDVEHVRVYPLPKLFVDD